MHYRSVFVSDVHLGTPDCRADALLAFLRTVCMERLFLVGDIIDLEAMATRAYWPPSHAAVMAEILSLAARGIDVTYIPGNHDAPVRGLSGQTISGIKVRLNAEHRGADGLRYRVSHGDEYDSERLGKEWLVWLGEYARQFVCWINRGFNGVRQRFGLNYLPLPIVAKSRIGAALTYIREYESRVVAGARDGGFDGHICGHIHFGAIREIDGIRYYNDGDWVEHCTALTEGHDGTWSLVHWTGRAIELVTATAEGVVAHVPAHLPLRSMEAAVEARPRRAA